MVEIRMCGKQDVTALMQFIDEHWASGHVLSWCQPLMDWQHFDPEFNRYNFVLGWQGSKLVGVLGFIPNRLYDPNLHDDSVCWLALWKIRQDVRIAGLGLSLLNHLQQKEKCAALGAIGIGPSELLGVYKALGFTTGEFRQYFVTHPGMPLSVARIPAGSPRPIPAKGDLVFEGLSANTVESAVQEIDLAWRANVQPRKTGAYFRNRYLEHPVYRYQVHMLCEDGAPSGLIATRVATCGKSRVLRIVDLLATPDAFSRSGSAIAKLLEETESEYADIWSVGFPEEAVTAAGFLAVDPRGATIVPNYFEPFQPRNGRIVYAYKGPVGSSFNLFRADGDQDRPNRIPRQRAPKVTRR